jgi:hypothetical protein
LRSILRGVVFCMLAVLLSAPLVAAEGNHLGRGLSNRIADLPTIPAEWAGIWSTVDSVFACTGALESVDTYMDTLCVGASVGGNEDVPVGSFTCSGNVDATTATFSCNGSEFIDPCTATFSSSTQATRSGDTYSGTTSTSFEFSGGLECQFIPGFCEEIRFTATRVASAPEECSVAVEDVPWTHLKKIYR